MPLRNTILIPCLGLAVLLAGAGFASASIVVNGSALLSQTDADQLETWLGEGPIVLTNIFSKTNGDGQTGADFHTATDGMGRTFSVIQVRGSNQVVGGYNPQSWRSDTNSYNVTASDAERTAFLFNLSDLLVGKIDQGLIANVGSHGQYQTFNHANYGPTFGNGHDLHVAPSLDTGFANPLSYGYSNAPYNVFGTQTSDSFTIESLEVFLITTAEGTVPEPTSFVVWGVLCSVGLRRWRRC